MAITAEMVRKLRAATGAGMMDVKKALEETDGDFDKAAALLRERGIAKAVKRADREASEGLVGTYVHHNGRLAVMVELNCETDFVARNEQFIELAKDIAMHVAMANPRYLKRDDIPADVLNAEKETLTRQIADEGKPEHIAEKIVEGRLDKFVSEITLLEQPYIKDDKKTIEELLAEAIATIGENIQISRFARFAIGE